MKIIFLDIDGVLNCQSFLYNPIKRILPKKIRNNPKYLISRTNLFWVSMLCRITKAKVILSTSWRYFWDDNGKIKEEAECERHGVVDKLLRKNGIDIIGRTPCGKVENPKNHEMNEVETDKYINRMNSTLHFIDDKGATIYETPETLKTYSRGAQILDWIDKNNFQDEFVILEDDWSEIVIYKDLENHLVKTSFYKRYGGFRFLHLIKALKILKGE